MCGIAGFVGKGSLELGREMIRCIRYRGPDYQDVFFDGKVCMGHARLSIIDLSPGANQPMFSDDKKAAIVFNGEIYNFKELRESLRKTGKYQFHTDSDTEVLLCLYREYGKMMLEMIHGMFVFALYDFVAGELFLARDRMGKKPLYFSECHDGTFVFASELGPVMLHPSVKKEINPEALNQYLTFDYVLTPASINQNVFKLEPAHYLVFGEGKIKERKAYWKHDFTVNTAITFEDAKSRLDGLLNDATECRLMSDVPLGVFLSGGLDSSAISYYAQKNASQTIKSFSIGFEDKSYDEQHYALQVAKHLGTDHAFDVLTPSKSLELLDEIFPLLDEPFADASIIPTYFLSKFTRSQVTVALGGDGSDELFAGYPTFISDKFRGTVQWMPKVMIKAMLKTASLLPVSDANISFDFKIKQFLRGFLGDSISTHPLWLGSFLPEEKKRLFKPGVYDMLHDKSGLGILHQILDNPELKDEISKTVYYYYRTYLLDDILVKVDRASMLNSLEVRAPFLDTRVVEFANALPYEFKHKGVGGKYILKKTMEGKLPSNIIYRPKKGFGIPLSDWIRTDLKKRIEEVLLEEDHYFNMDFISKMLKEHHSHQNNHRKLIWNLYVVKRYIRQHGY